MLMASEVEICNRALQKLGAKRIVSLSDDSVNARACTLAYEVVRDAELQEHRWSFAIQRFALAAEALAPEWGRTNAFALPTGCLKLIPPYPEDDSPDRDWVLESNQILTNDSAPLYVRCVMQVTDPNAMHVLFREALSAKLAVELCEEITQSNTKKAALQSDYKDAITKAKKHSAIESVPMTPVEDSWITGRS
jgi:hypothetical protein